MLSFIVMYRFSVPFSPLLLFTCSYGSLSLSFSRFIFIFFFKKKLFIYATLTLMHPGVVPFFFFLSVFVQLLCPTVV